MTTTTTTQPRHTTARWLTAPFRVIRHLNEELTGAGAAIGGSNRFPQRRPQSRAQADWTVAKRAAWA
jgi:hypothetical protein